MKLLYVFKERAPIFIELAWRISLSSADLLPDLVPFGVGVT